MIHGDEIPIGSMVPLTGRSANDGREFRNGLILAIDEINERGGILGRRIRPVFFDTVDQTAKEVVRAANTLIHDHNVHAIINGYNIGAQNSEYEPIADAGIIYIHHNTLLQHHDTVMSDPNRYFGCFMGDPSEYWYGQGFIKFISWLRDTGQWKPHNRKIAIISGPKPYSIVIANAMASVSPQFGWELPFTPRIARSMENDWRTVLDEVREHDPAVLAVTQFHAGDLANFQLQFMENPLRCLLYLQYGALHRSFANMVGSKGRGAIVGTVIGLLRDDLGRVFAEKYKTKFGQYSTPEIGCQPYSSMHHYAIAAAVAGGTSPPGGRATNQKIAQNLRELSYRSVSGMIRYHPKWQAVVPYPDATPDPSLGLPHLFYQLRGPEDEPALIAPQPFADAHFTVPPWLMPA
ncbi:ABC transporter substrate-binding protein [Sinorhizobium meliloti]|uniref:ABC transporter substrate-binding protein n=1 Tax=Rhizobium meliloti TaxID=382 RepID=UPI00208FFFD1|nr:ABC transporter substrate-binding protein [Sinorhizobium meliloti]MCO5966364.1 ABC transporter substrate-binding protein [Sinorhizobium meliloti]